MVQTMLDLNVGEFVSEFVTQPFQGQPTVIHCNNSDTDPLTLTRGAF